VNHSAARPSVSVAVCTHNGAKRLEPTLEHLRAQTVSTDLRWEVLVIDNASTDQTGELARHLWADGPAQLRIVTEPRLGEWNARRRALEEARCEVIGFVDDDNWVAGNWVENLSEVMGEDELIGACGSIITPVFESAPPDWFERFQKYYAVVKEEQCTPNPISICAAGMGVRAVAWRELLARGFRSHLGGRVGGGLQSCADTELSYALNLAGWKLLIDRRLRIQHYMPASRLDWNYLRRLVQGSAYSAVALDGYHFAYQDPAANFRDRLRQHWLWPFAAGVRQLARLGRIAKLLLSRFAPMMNDDEVIQIDMQLAQLRGLASLRGRYSELRREVREAPWRKQNRLGLPGAA
jgi:glycosyltransferase involved in cell wall biosynthesis